MPKRGLIIGAVVVAFIGVACCSASAIGVATWSVLSVADRDEVMPVEAGEAERVPDLFTQGAEVDVIVEHAIEVVDVSQIDDVDTDPAVDAVAAPAPVTRARPAPRTRPEPSPAPVTPTTVAVLAPAEEDLGDLDLERTEIEVLDEEDDSRRGRRSRRQRD